MHIELICNCCARVYQQISSVPSLRRNGRFEYTFIIVVHINDSYNICYVLRVVNPSYTLTTH